MLNKISVGNYNWYVIATTGDKYYIIADAPIFEGYYSFTPCAFPESKLYKFLNDRFVEILKDSGVDTSLLVNIHIPTLGQYKIYVENRLPVTPIPYLLCTPDSEKADNVMAVQGDRIISVNAKSSCGIRPCMFIDRAYANTLAGVDELEDLSVEPTFDNLENNTSTDSNTNIRDEEMYDMSAVNTTTEETEAKTISGTFMEDIPEETEQLLNQIEASDEKQSENADDSTNKNFEDIELIEDLGFDPFDTIEGLRPRKTDTKELQTDPEPSTDNTGPVFFEDVINSESDPIAEFIQSESQPLSDAAGSESDSLIPVAKPKFDLFENTASQEIAAEQTSSDIAEINLPRVENVEESEDLKSFSYREEYGKKTAYIFGRDDEYKQFGIIVDMNADEKELAKLYGSVISDFTKNNNENKRERVTSDKIKNNIMRQQNRWNWKNRQLR